MGKKFHINRKGVPAVCFATKRPCPFGGEEKHYNSEREAQIAANKKNEEEFGTFHELKKKEPVKKRPAPTTHRWAKSKEERKIVKDRIQALADKPGRNYLDNCESSEKIRGYDKIKSTTKHYSEERVDRDNKIELNFGRGRLIGYYRVRHLILNWRTKKKEMGYQVVEIRDNGQTTFYDDKTGVKVTTFIPNSERIEVFMLRAGEIPEESFLANSLENMRKFQMEERMLEKAKKRKRLDKEKAEVKARSKKKEKENDKKVAKDKDV